MLSIINCDEENLCDHLKIECNSLIDGGLTKQLTIDCRGGFGNCPPFTDMVTASISKASKLPI